MVSPKHRLMHYPYIGKGCMHIMSLLCQFRRMTFCSIVMAVTCDKSSVDVIVSSLHTTVLLLWVVCVAVLLLCVAEFGCGGGVVVCV